MKLLKLFFLCLLLALLPPNSHAATGDYTLVTNASDLQAGDKIVMVGVNVKFSVRFAMSTEQKSSNRGAVNNLSGFSDNNTKLSLNNPSVQEIELQNGTENGKLAFYVTGTTNGYLYAASSLSNHLKTASTLSDNSSAEITITSGEATIIFQGSNTRNVLRANYNNGTPLFACYSSASQDPVLIYKLEQAQTKTLTGISIEGTPTKTEYHDGDTFDPTGLIVKANYDDNSQTDITNFPNVAWSINPDPLTLSTTSVTATATYEGFTANITCPVTVTAAPEPPAGKVYNLVTSAADLAADDVIVFAYVNADKSKQAAMGAQSVKFRSSVDVTGGFSSDLSTLTITDQDVREVTLKNGNETGTFAFYVDNKYLASATSNAVTEQESIDANSSATITIEDNKAEIIFGGDNSCKIFSYNSSSPRFACYPSASQQKVYIYKLAGEVSPLVGITAEGTPEPLTVGQEFNHNGITVTATYENGSTKDVTNSAQYSGYDLSTAGTTTVTVTYQEGEVTKTTSYQVTVNDPVTYTIAEFNELDNDVIATFRLPVTVIAQGNAGATDSIRQRIFVRDETGYMLIYGNVDKKYNRGDVIPAGFSGTKTTYAGEPELKDPSGLQDAIGTATVEPEDLTEGAMINHANFGHYVFSQNVKIDSVDTQNLYFILHNGDRVRGYNNFTPHLTLPTDRNLRYDIYGIVTSFFNSQTVDYDILLTEWSAAANPDMYTVTFDAPENGSISIMAGETVINSGDQVENGTTLTVTITPSSGYKLCNWTATTTSGPLSLSPEETTFVVENSDVNISAAFEAMTVYTYSWAVNRQMVKVETLTEGEAVVPAEAPATLIFDGVEKVFYGWVETPTVDPNVVTVVTPDETARRNCTYYAVYATETTTSTTEGTYYEEVPSDYTNWLEGEYIMATGVGNSALVFTGLGSGVSNKVGGPIVQQNGVNIIRHKDEFATLKMVKPGQWMHMLVKQPGDTNYGRYLYCESGDSKFEVHTIQEIDANDNGDISEGSELENTKYGLTIKWGGNNRWLARINYRYLCYSNSVHDFRTSSDSTQNQAIKFFLKKEGTTTTYSDYTTGEDNLITLKELVLLGPDAQGGEYTISNDLQAVALLHEKSTGNNILLLKDYNDAAHKVTPAAGDQPFLIKAHSYFTDDVALTTNDLAQENYDQSNWLEVVLPGNITTEVAGLVNHKIAGGSIMGDYVDATNPRIVLDLTKQLNDGGAQEVYSRNPMSPANFIGSQKGYFFMPPKNNEFVQVVWAVYHDGAFYCPDKNAGNGNEFEGCIEVGSNDYNVGEGAPELQNGVAYQFRAVAKRKVAPAATSKKKEFGHTVTNGISTYSVYPIDLAHNEHIITGIDGVGEARTVARVTYYNLQGAASDHMQDGVNIVVTHYTDGSHTATKVMR